MRLGDRPRDVEPEARARLRVAAPVARPNFSKISRWSSAGDPRPAVRHRDRRRSRSAARRSHRHRLARRRVLDGVVDQVAEHLAQALRVAAHGSAARRGELGDDGTSSCAIAAAATVSSHERGDVDVGEAVAERARVDARGVEHVADERGQARRLVADQREERLALRPAAARASGAAGCARPRSQPPSGCAARARRARRSRRAARRAAAAPRRCGARSRRRGCSARRTRRAARAG